MDFSEIQKALDFLNWQMVVANAILLMGWVQICKPYIADPTIKGVKMPVTILFSLVSSMALSHFVFDVAGVKHTETIALFHGFSSFVISSLGYEILKGTKLGLRSGTEIKNGKEEVKK